MVNKLYINYSIYKMSAEHMDAGVGLSADGEDEFKSAVHTGKFTSNEQIEHA